MAKLQFALAGLAAAALVGTAPVAADEYLESGAAHTYAQGSELLVADDGDIGHGYVEVGYRGTPAYRYGPAYVPGPPDLWRQREVAYDAIFTRDKRIIYDSGLAAQSRAAAEFYGRRVYGYGPPAYYRSPGYGSAKGYWAPPVGLAAPSGNCGTFRYWNGEGCVDARYFSRYTNPYKWKYLHK